MRLIINSDDFGLTKSITDGIVEGIMGGYITSTSLMANLEFTEYAIKKALENKIKCVGLHINFTKGKPIIPNDHLTDESGMFLHRSIQMENTNITYEDAYNEIKSQLDVVNKISNGRLKIDHLDSHHFICHNEAVKKALIDIAKEYNIPIRNEFECKVRKPDLFYTGFSLNNIEYNELEKMIANYKDKDISVELMTHAGFVDDYTISVTSYNIQRKTELDLLKQAKENGLFDKVELISFEQL